MLIFLRNKVFPIGRKFYTTVLRTWFVDLKALLLLLCIGVLPEKLKSSANIDPWDLYSRIYRVNKYTIRS